MCLREACSKICQWAVTNLYSEMVSVQHGCYSYLTSQEYQELSVP